MRFIIALIICAAAPFQFYEDISTWIAKTPCRIFSNLDYNKYEMNDDVLSIPISKDLNINEQNDTIYVDEIIHDGHLSAIGMWKNNNPKIFFYTDSCIRVCKKSSRDWLIYELVKSWEPDVLRHIGNEAQRHIIPMSTTYTARIIFNQGNTIIDTVSYHNLGEIDRITKHQLDSIREVVKLKKLAEKEDSLKSDKDSIQPTYGAANDIATKDFITTQQQKEPKSFWERFLDWLRKLWKAIFG